MSTKPVLILLAIFFVTAVAASAQGPVVLYNPAADIGGEKPSETDEAFVKEKLVPKSAAHWKEDESCNGEGVNVIGGVDGSFTRAGAKQRAIVYELCQTGNGFANNCVAVIENGKLIAHFVEAGGWNLELSKAPDINKNGRDELVIETGGGMHQGYTGSSITILELSATAVVELGVYLAYTNECENHAPNKYCDRSYKIVVTPGAKPVITAQKYVNRGDDEKPRWVVSGKPLPAKAIAGTENKYQLLK